MVNFGSLAAEIDPVVYGIPANFNRFRVLAALLHGTPVVGVSQTAALNRDRQLCSPGRPSRWALAHILVIDYYSLCNSFVASSATAFDFHLIGLVQSYCRLDHVSQK